MRLLYLINGLGAGGAERSLAELLPHMRAAGIETTVVCLRRREIGVESEVRLTDCRVEVLAGRTHLQRARELRLLLREIRPDVVHTTLFDSHVAGRLGAAGTGIPVISSLVGTPYVASRARDERLSRKAFRFVREIDGWTARHLTTHFHAISHAVRDSYVAALRIHPERITVIERGRDTHRLGEPSEERRLRVRAMLGIAADQPVLINVGRQEHPKGQWTLLQAAASLLPRNPELRVLIAGREGHMTPALRSMHAQLGLNGHVVFLGHRTDVPDLLAASDIFVFPSLHEGLGGAALEAMALGLPVVASDLPALREVVEHGRTGVLVPADSPEALAGALDALIGDTALRAEYGQRARGRFHARFDLARSARRMIALYHTVAHGAAGATQDVRVSHA